MGTLPLAGLLFFWAVWVILVSLNHEVRHNRLTFMHSLKKCRLMH
jgi:hypothetical protein